MDLTSPAVSSERATKYSSDCLDSSTESSSCAIACCNKASRVTTGRCLRRTRCQRYRKPGGRIRGSRISNKVSPMIRASVAIVTLFAAVPRYRAVDVFPLGQMPTTEAPREPKGSRARLFTRGEYPNDMNPEYSELYLNQTRIEHLWLSEVCLRRVEGKEDPRAQTRHGSIRGFGDNLKWVPGGYAKATDGGFYITRPRTPGAPPTPIFPEKLWTLHLDSSDVGANNESRARETVWIDGPVLLTQPVHRYRPSVFYHVMQTAFTLAEQLKSALCIESFLREERRGGSGPSKLKVLEMTNAWNYYKSEDPKNKFGGEFFAAFPGVDIYLFDSKDFSERAVPPMPLDVCFQDLIIAMPDNDLVDAARAAGAAEQGRKAEGTNDVDMTSAVRSVLPARDLPKDGCGGQFALPSPPEMFAKPYGGNPHEVAWPKAAMITIIQRGEGQGRCILNANFVRERLRQKGIKARLVVLESLNLWEQFRIIWSSSTLVAAHGSALAWGELLAPFAAVVQIQTTPCAINGTFNFRQRPNWATLHALPEAIVLPEQDCEKGRPWPENDRRDLVANVEHVVEAVEHVDYFLNGGILGATYVEGKLYPHNIPHQYAR